MKKVFSRNDLAAIKRAAANIAPLATKRDKLYVKINKLREELDGVESSIALYNIAIQGMTGFNAEDLVEKKDGAWIFKYPETIIPEIINENPQEEVVADIDDNEKVEEIETTPAEAPFKLPY